MSKSCPVNFERIDATNVRIVSCLMAAAVTAFLLSGMLWIIMVLILDVTLRLYGEKRYSLLYPLALLIQKSLQLKPVYEDAAAKRLAAHFALLFMILLGATFVMDYELLHVSLAAVYLSCSTLEVLFSYCLGCKIYELFQRYRV